MINITNIENKYKDRLPEETIEIIKNFFENQGFTIKEMISEKTESNTWWCGLDLFFKDVFLLHSNGKGTTEVFSKASGYAEMYERFCFKCNKLSGSLLDKEIKRKNFDKNNYYMAPDEKILSYDEVVFNSFRIQNTFQYLDDKKGNLKSYFNLIKDNKFIALPYTGINSKDVKYLSPEFILMITGSDGAAAGNTIEEAIVQGTSEVYEHLMWSEVYKDIKVPLPELDFETLDVSDYLKNIGQEILKQNYTFKIIDYSYLYGIPVIGVYLIDKNSYTMQIILGVHPIFEIALERCFTEIYQGFVTLKALDKKMIPSKNISNLEEYQCLQSHSLSKRECYLEKHFSNFLKKDSFNKEVFLEKNNYTNKELYDYFVALNNKMGYDFYYRDYSLCEEMKAVHVFVDNFIVFDFLNCYIKTIPDNVKTNLIKFSEKMFLTFQEYLNTGSLDSLKNCERIFKEYKDIVQDEKLNKFLIYLNLYTPLSVYKNQAENFLQSLYKFNKNDSKEIFNFLISIQVYENFYEQEYQDRAIKYRNLYAYGVNPNYSLDEIKNILELFGQKLDKEDYLNRNNLFYYFYKIILEPTYILYHSETFNELSEIMMNGVKNA